ncbi:MAG: 2TM domain-containing protein [Rubrivivax sp.]|nr:2TM domain-containing protein [Rubrivivax sp.]
MDRSLTDDEIHARAKKRVDMKMGFYVHALVFVCVNLGLFAINQTVGGTRWHGFPLMGWGLGLAIHGIVTFLSLRGDGFRERMLDDEIQRLKGRR